MPEPTVADTTRLLRAWARGDSGALEQLTPRVYGELRRVAARLLRRERSGESLQTCDLVHEAYLRLMDASNLQWQDRAHFFAVAATLMRRILLDRARRKMTAKRGGRPLQVDLDEAVELSLRGPRQLIALDDALRVLAGVDPLKGRIVELRFFGGLTVQETAEVVGLSAVTVNQHWKTARAWLLAEVAGRA